MSSFLISSALLHIWGESGPYDFRGLCVGAGIQLPSSYSITRLVIRSISELEREKFRYLHPKKRRTGRTHMNLLCPASGTGIPSSPELGSPDDGIVNEEQALILDQVVDGDQLHLGDQVPPCSGWSA